MNKRGKASSSTITVIIVVIIAFAAMAGVIAWQQFTTTYAYIAASTIPAGTKITSEMLDKKIIQRVSVSKQFEGSNLVQDYEQLVGRFTQDEIKPGKMIFAYDIASKYDIRVNPILQDNNFEAFTIKKGNFAAGATTNLLNKDDRVNIYTVTTFDLSDIKSIKQNGVLTGNTYESDGDVGTTGNASMTKELMKRIGVSVSELPDNIKKICLDSGLDEDHIFYEDQITIAKLTWQNVPVINVIKTSGSSAVDTTLTEITLGVDSQTAEEMYVAMQTGGLGFTTLPYIDGEYSVIDNSGTTNIGIYDFGRSFN